MSPTATTTAGGAVDIASGRRDGVTTADMADRVRDQAAHNQEARGLFVPRRRRDRCLRYPPEGGVDLDCRCGLVVDCSGRVVKRRGCQAGRLAHMVAANNGLRRPIA
jgi:hypothetical protein